jgi:UDP-N-acetylmuramoylalanine--D-glutamate ligase
VLIGRDAPRLAAALDGACGTEIVADMPTAVRAARAAAQPGDTVLLSPACASLDMFRDYAHRGEEFAASVRSLAA